MKPLAVIDTNIIVSGLLSQKSAPYKILSSMFQAKFSYLLSKELLDEYKRVLLRKNVQKNHGLEEQEIVELLINITENGIIKELEEIQEQAPHKNDNHLWQLLYTHQPSILVTGDLLLIKKPPSFAKVMLPGDFIDRVNSFLINMDSSD